MSEREPITAELRRVMNHTTMAGIPLVEIGEYEFGHRCDAIDAVHAALERENAELRQRVAVLDNADGNMHDGWIRLPLDADGEYIHVGDEMCGYGWPNGGVYCRAIVNEVTILVGPQDGAYRGWLMWAANECRHHHAPTVEDVLREFADEMNQNLGMYTGEAIDADEWRDADNKTVEKYAKRLTLAGDAE